MEDQMLEMECNQNEPKIVWNEYNFDGEKGLKSLDKYRTPDCQVHNGDLNSLDNFSSMNSGRQSSVDDLSGRCSEILVHEVDTDSDAGSEDVELLPHRYASSNLHGGHVYVNRLSLATELLRTKEPLPYDNDLKLVVGDGKGEDKHSVRFGSVVDKSPTEFSENCEENNGCPGSTDGHLTNAIKNSCSERQYFEKKNVRLGFREVSPLLCGSSHIQQCPCVIL